MIPHYYLQIFDYKPQEVTVEEFVKAERGSGFHGPGHQANPPRPATAGFSANFIRGWIEYTKK